MKNRKGYSLIVLIIAVIVILIITGGAITTLNISMEDRKINNFIYDINNIEEATKQYYSASGIIPVIDGNVDISNIVSAGQIDSYDGSVYSILDISKLDANNIHEKDKTYIVNAESLKVYMIEGIEYKGTTYYTVTDKLMGSNTKYESQNMDIVCTVSPSVWTGKANIRVTVPQGDITGWTFKYSRGPKDASFFASAGDETKFDYGKPITVKDNGAYSIYVKDSEGKETVKNVVVRNIDDIPPKYKLQDNNLTIMDDELGIKEIRYKTYSDEYDNMSADGKLEFYLLGGKGNTVESLAIDIANYNNQKAIIDGEKTKLNSDYASLSEEEKEQLSEQYTTSRNALTEKENELNDQYAHILNENTRYVLYVEDLNGNAIVITEEIITLLKVRQMFNI